MTLDSNTAIAIGVGLNLLGSLIRHFVHEPKKKAQIDSLQEQVATLVEQVAQKGGGA